jgi:hypothetical protein
MCGTDSARTPRSTDRVLTPDFALSYACLFGFGGNMVKKSKIMSFPFGLILIAHFMGCNGDASSPEEVADGMLDPAIYNSEFPSTQSIILTNAMEPEVLVPTDMGSYPLSLSAMSPTSAAELQSPSGASLRRLLEYVVGCALPVGDHFQFDWMDATGTMHQESYQGRGGLAPNWKNAAMNVAEQEWVSACVAARTNWYGTSVHISMRGNLPLLVPDVSESHTFPVREGAFWGNIFSSTPHLSACFDSDNVLHSRALGRECAAGHDEFGVVEECGMISIVGSCQQTCSAPNTSGYYGRCSVNPDELMVGPQTNRVITVFLR